MRLPASIRLLALMLALLGTAEFRARAGTIIRMNSPFGALLIELFDEEKPLTVDNFLRYAASGYWSNLFTYRIEPGFVLQAGGYGVADRGTPGAAFVRIPRLDPVPNEFLVGPRRSNVRGTLAMAKLANQPDSATAEWFLNLGDNSADLDSQNGGFTVFGRVVSGDPILDIFNGFSWRRSEAEQSTNRLYYVGNPGPFNQFPRPPAFPTLEPLTDANVLFDHLVHLDITVVSLSARPLSDQTPGIAWTSLPGRIHHVETAAHPAGPWTSLYSGIPNETRPRVRDPDPGVGPRYYRVRVEEGLRDP